MVKFTDEETRGFPLTGGADAPTADETASSRREAWDPDSYDRNGAFDGFQVVTDAEGGF